MDSDEYIQSIQSVACICSCTWTWLFLNIRVHITSWFWAAQYRLDCGKKSKFPSRFKIKEHLNKMSCSVAVVLNKHQFLLRIIREISCFFTFPHAFIWALLVRETPHYYHDFIKDYNTIHSVWVVSSHYDDPLRSRLFSPLFSLLYCLSCLINMAIFFDFTRLSTLSTRLIMTVCLHYVLLYKKKIYSI